jgi:integrase
MSNILHARINNTMVERLGDRQTIRDTALTGFGVRRQTGNPFYFLQKRIGPRIRWITIGRHGQPWTAETARKEAYRLLGQIAGGDEPRMKRQDLADRPTLTDAANLFLAEHGVRLKPGSFKKYQFLINQYVLPALGDRLIERIARPDILKLHASMAAKSPLANYTVAVLSKLMSWAEEHGMRPSQSNPCFKIKKFRENKRHRYLSEDEYRRLGKVLVQIEVIDIENYYIAAAIRILMLTGARVGEILSLTWRSVDLERALLILPDSKTGQKIIRLNPQAVEILATIRRADANPHVIVGRRTGAHLVNLQKPWRRIRKLAEMEDVRIHDLRHSYASVAAAAKGSLPMIGRLLGHNHQNTTARYAHLADDPVDDLNATIGRTIAEAIGVTASKSDPTDSKSSDH